MSFAWMMNSARSGCSGTAASSLRRSACCCVRVLRLRLQPGEVGLEVVGLLLLGRRLGLRRAQVVAERGVQHEVPEEDDRQERRAADEELVALHGVTLNWSARLLLALSVRLAVEENVTFSRRARSVSLGARTAALRRARHPQVREVGHVGADALDPRGHGVEARADRREVRGADGAGARWSAPRGRRRRRAACCAGPAHGALERREPDVGRDRARERLEHRGPRDVGRRAAPGSAAASVSIWVWRCATSESELIWLCSCAVLSPRPRASLSRSSSTWLFLRK